MVLKEKKWKEKEAAVAVTAFPSWDQLCAVGVWEMVPDWDRVLKAEHKGYLRTPVCQPQILSSDEEKFLPAVS